ncbi:MAG: M14 family zinc carboxypeptidase [Bacteroidia bacterium]|nr:M14 family zinc carboxypeptidase [Bacteroidia bacterium]
MKEKCSHWVLSGHLISLKPVSAGSRIRISNVLVLASFFSAVILLFDTPSRAQEIGYPTALYSRAERTGYLETTLYADLMDFADALKRGSPIVQVETMGTSYRGKSIPLIILADPMVSSPEEAKASGKLVVYIQGNLHGGEVDGKEAILALMREIVFGPQRRLLKNHILLFCPVFNIDGNDSLGPNNRESQDGSPALAGVRTNGQGFDLNRDGMKLETIEGKALAGKVLLRWDPLVWVDLHTTNGTWHGYSITYSPGKLSAGHPGTVNYLKNFLLPAVRDKVRERAGYDTFYFGDFYEYPPKTFLGIPAEPKIFTNSLALKNRMAILVETFAHDRFERRIDSNIAYMVSLLEYTSSHATEILNLIGSIENDVVTEITGSAGNLQRGVRYQAVDPGEKADLLVYEVLGGKHTGKRIWFPNVNLILDYQPAKLSTVPMAYVFPAELTDIAAKLREHGVKVTQLDQTISFKGEQFTVTRLNHADQNYQGHYLADLEGLFQPAIQDWPAGSFYIDMAQPLAYLIFYLLEPQSDDGLVAWNYFDQFLLNQGVNNQNVIFPVFKSAGAGGSFAENQPRSAQPRVFPNPAADRMTIADLPISSEPLVIEILNQAGQIIIQKQFPGNQSTVTIETSVFKKGIYFVRIKGSGSLIKTFIDAREE